MGQRQQARERRGHRAAEVDHGPFPTRAAARSDHQTGRQGFPERHAPADRGAALVDRLDDLDDAVTSALRHGAHDQGGKQGAERRSQEPGPPWRLLQQREQAALRLVKGSVERLEEDQRVVQAQAQRGGQGHRTQPAGLEERQALTERAERKGRGQHQRGHGGELQVPVRGFQVRAKRLAPGNVASPEQRRHDLIAAEHHQLDGSDGGGEQPRGNSAVQADHGGHRHHQGALERKTRRVSPQRTRRPPPEGQLFLGHGDVVAEGSLSRFVSCGSERLTIEPPSN